MEGDSDAKVFSSNILRSDSQECNELQDLLEVVPAKPIDVKCEGITDCYFRPKMDKYYVPKKRSRLKVKTVRDIRNLFEQDTFAYLNEDLEKQQTFLLRKIRAGSSNAKSTKTLASKIIENNNPLNRTAWQMLVNINPQEHLNPKQFVLWKGKYIQINGSRGGTKKIIFNFDRKKCDNMPAKNKPYSKVAGERVTGKRVKRKGLLQNSLAIKFKPGPLQRKKFLDDSHQKYHIGHIELVDIPSPALEVMPSYGSVFDSSILKILNSFRDDYGIISEKWAEFAVSVLGKSPNKSVIQTNEECNITFNLKYNCDKRKILMRQDIDNITSLNRDKNNEINIQSENNSEINLEVQHVMVDILNAVEISLIQDSTLFVKDDPDVRDDEPLIIPEVIVKDKSRKRYAELDRLAVTVIELPESSQNNSSLPCKKSYCRLGCICDSLHQTFILKQHCGCLECMFGCKCQRSKKYKDIENLKQGDSEFIPGLINLDSAINSNLAKEEQKFHQTVVLSGQQSILLKERKRNRQSTKKYADYLRSSNINTNIKNKRKLMIIENKLDCANIEPWCMVHNLYRCFCKGKFTESSITLNAEYNYNKPEIENNTTISPEENPAKMENYLDNNSIKNNLRPRVAVDRKTSDNDFYYSSCDDSSHDIISTCARTSEYDHRNYSNEYYRRTNNKILEMEKNDVSLQRKLLKLTNRIDDNDININYVKDSLKFSDLPTKKSLKVTIEKNNIAAAAPDESKIKLIAWLETNYKIYKERLERGIIKNSLEPPQRQKLVLHTFEFILARYRERKNLFLVSKQKPYRIFMAVNKKHPFFDDCINIDDIRFAELNKYPPVIRNLLTNATDLKDNFCILGGKDWCWELIGSVTKVISEKQRDASEIFDTDAIIMQDSPKVNDEKLSHIINSVDNDLKLVKDADIGLPISNQSESSKWFLMTIEDDFTEIQFYKKGFYVKYDSIVQAIGLARKSGKTVRLSSQICSEKNNGTQFGLYATPNINQSCVFVGPYEFEEQLGLETLKKPRPRNLKKTRGVWIITNKVDNDNIINDPLSFIPVKMEHSVIIVGQESPSSSKDGNSHANNQLTCESDKNNKETEEKVKTINNKPIVKPIKIRRTNGFYHLSSNSMLRNTTKHPGSLLNSHVSYPKTLIINPSDSILKKDDKINDSEISEGVSDIKITAVYSEYGETSNKEVEANKPKKSTGMLILKPDEINKKMLQSVLIKDAVDDTTVMSNCVMDNVDDENATNFVPLISPNDNSKGKNNQQFNDTKDEVFCISESDEDDNIPGRNDYRIIFIQSTNTKCIYWVVGRKRKDSRISFRLQNSLEFSEYYPKDDIFTELNSYLAMRKFNVQGVKWKIVDSVKEVKGSPLTGSNRARSMCVALPEQTDTAGVTVKTYSRNKKTSFEPRFLQTPLAPNIILINQVSDNLVEMETTNRLLEDKAEMLWNEAKSKGTEIIDCLSTPENISDEMTDELQNIMEDFNDEDHESNNVIRLFE